jgi:phosphatidylserine/phosphatidylglycerophosphate/cardiolipin synthase-like enzyme
LRKRIRKIRRRSTIALDQQDRWIQVSLTALILIAVVLGMYYLRTGSDPLGWFNPPEPTPRPTPSGGEDTWWQVHFTDPPTAFDPDDLEGSIPEKLIGLINDAERTIHIAAFEFDLRPVADALIAAHARGVEVQWVTDDEFGIEADTDEGNDLFPLLKKAGIKVKDDGRTALMHNKFWIFDGRTVWTGSTNVTVNGSFRNNNNVLVIDSPLVAEIFEREFVELWSGQFGPTSPSTPGVQMATVDGTPIQILFAAEDEVASQLISLIEGARRKIRFMVFSFTHSKIGSAMLARAKAGVDVRGIVETRGSQTKHSELSRLYCAGLQVRQDGNSGMFHHKVLVIDDKILITGSFNFSHSADDSNDENVVIVTDRKIASQYTQEFARRWNEANAVDPASINCR